MTLFLVALILSGSSLLSLEFKIIIKLQSHQNYALLVFDLSLDDSLFNCQQTSSLQQLRNLILNLCDRVSSRYLNFMLSARLPIGSS